MENTRYDWAGGSFHSLLTLWTKSNNISWPDRHSIEIEHREFLNQIWHCEHSFQKWLIKQIYADQTIICFPYIYINILKLWVVFIWCGFYKRGMKMEIYQINISRWVQNLYFICFVWTFQVDKRLDSVLVTILTLYMTEINKKLRFNLVILCMKSKCFCQWCILYFVCAPSNNDVLCSIQSSICFQFITDIIYSFD